MRPDPWQKEKSRRYQAQRKARGLEVKGSKKEGRVEERVRSTDAVSTGGFKFVKPMPAPQPQYEAGSEAEEEDEYDVGQLEDAGFDFSALSLHDLTSHDQEFLTAEELNDLNEAVDFQISGLEQLSKWLQGRIKGKEAELFRLDPIEPPSTSVPCSSPSSPTVFLETPKQRSAQSRVDPLEDMLDDMLDT